MANELRDVTSEQRLVYAEQKISPAVIESGMEGVFTFVHECVKREVERFLEEHGYKEVPNSMSFVTLRLEVLAVPNE